MSGAARSSCCCPPTCTWRAGRSSWRRRLPWSSCCRRACSRASRRSRCGSASRACPGATRSRPLRACSRSRPSPCWSTAGFVGSRDPLANPLPLFVWTVWWIGFTYLHAAFGNLWAHVNPWTGLYRLLTAVGRLRRRREHPPLRVSAVGRALARGGGLPRVRLVRADPSGAVRSRGARQRGRELPPLPLRRRARLRGAVAPGGGAVLGVLPHGVLARAARRAALEPPRTGLRRAARRSS